MTFERPDAITAMSEAIAAAGEAGDCWDVVGEPLDASIDRASAHDGGLTANRNELGDLRWGRIEADVARLTGLAAAIDNVSSVVRKGREALAHDWSGQSFDAFRVAIERVEQTLNDYSAAVKATAKGFGAALSSIRTQYQSYRDNSLRILAFDDFTGEEKDAIERKIAEWYRATDELKSGVRRAYQAALENLRILAEHRTFATLPVPGTAIPATTSAAGYAGAADFGAAGNAALGHPAPHPSNEHGEASLASAADDGDAAPSSEASDQQPRGMAGGLPMLGGIGAGRDSGRAGSVWQVHGDLFEDAAGVVLDEEER